MSARIASDLMIFLESPNFFINYGIYLASVTLPISPSIFWAGLLNRISIKRL
jgi:hypothetical protein